jgi:hypothetical protein
VEEVSADMLRFARPLRHPAALRVLLALERTPRGSTRLAGDLDLPVETARYVVDMLAGAGLVVVVDREPADAQERTIRRIYGTCHTGWAGVRDALGSVEPRADAS